MGEAFRLGGFGMFPTLAFGVLLVVAAVRYAARPEPRWISVLASLTLLTLASGSFGFTTGAINALLAAGEQGSGALALIGLGESLHNLALAFLLVVLGAGAACVGTVRQGRAARWVRGAVSAQAP